jgi:uncharacterized membrane protein YfcA
MLGHALLGGALAFILAVAGTPVGVSGAVFLIPVQVSLLHTPSPSVTPTNLLYNVIATPGALARYAGRGIVRAPLTSALVLGTLPGDPRRAAVGAERLLPGDRGGPDPARRVAGVREIAGRSANAACP